MKQISPQRRQFTFQGNWSDLSLLLAKSIWEPKKRAARENACINFISVHTKIITRWVTASEKAESSFSVHFLKDNHAQHQLSLSLVTTPIIPQPGGTPTLKETGKRQSTVKKRKGIFFRLTQMLRALQRQAEVLATSPSRNKRMQMPNQIREQCVNL